MEEFRGKIRSFRHNALRDYLADPTSGAARVPPDIRNKVVLKLWGLNAAVDLQSLRSPPGNHLKRLKNGTFAGYHSIRVNDRYRLTFRWEKDGAYDVDVTDHYDKSCFEHG